MTKELYQAFTGIKTGLTYHGIHGDIVTADVEMLLRTKQATVAELEAICDAIDGVTSALSVLERLTAKHMPAQTGGHCSDLQGNWKDNSLLKMFFEIMDSSLVFDGGVQNVNRKIRRVLKKQPKVFKKRKKRLVKK